MFYRKYSPHPHLWEFIECYYLWNSDTNLSKSLLVESPPSGFTSITINYGGNYKVSNNKHDFYTTPESFVSGQAISRYQLQLDGPIAMAGIVFKPTAIAKLFKIPMTELVEERVCLSYFVGQKADELREQLAEVNNSMQRVQLLEKFCFTQLGRYNVRTDVMDRIANAIVQQNGLIQMDELIKTAYMSQRQFQRRFLKLTGLSPKYFARLRRLSFLCNQLQTGQVDNWQHAVELGAYYDQAHFIRDFKTFMGIAPGVYYSGNKELSRLLE